MIADGLELSTCDVDLLIGLSAADSKLLTGEHVEVSTGDLAYLIRDLVLGLRHSVLLDDAHQVCDVTVEHVADEVLEEIVLKRSNIVLIVYCLESCHMKACNFNNLQ